MFIRVLTVVLFVHLAQLSIGQKPRQRNPDADFMKNMLRGKVDSTTQVALMIDLLVILIAILFFSNTNSAHH